jgi:hypothetical protein
MTIEQTDVTSGSDVLTADGEKYGTVRDKAETYLQVRVPHDALTDIEAYVPRKLIDRVEGDTIHLNKTASELEAMDLTTPPALD